MVKISSDSAESHSQIAYICDYLEQNGGYISPDIEIIDEGGQISVFGNASIEKSYIFKIPHDLLIPYESFDFDIEGEEIVVAHHDSNVSKQHRDLLSAMLALYNSSGKFKQHLAEHPALRFCKETPLINHLLSAREGRDIDIIRKTVERPDFHDEMALLTFFKSRMLNCRLHDKTAGYTPVLMPGIEFLNHHSRGAGYKSSYDEKGSHLITKAVMPVENSRECFTCYGRFDALDTYLHSGFIDENVKFIRSVPMRIDLGDVGILSIRGFNTIVPEQDVPEHLKDLAFYFPKIKFDHTHHIAELSHIFIPQEKALFSLRRILEHIIQTLAPKISEIDCRTYIGIAENQILSTNAEYNDKLELIYAQEAQDSQYEKPIFSLLNTQRKKLEKYANLVNS